MNIHHKRRPIRSSFFAASTMLVLTSCATNQEGSADESVESNSQELIAGFPADDPALNAVGSLSVRYDYGGGYSYYSLICSGVLIDNDTAVTAKHCVDDILYYVPDQPGTTIVFTIGPRADAPDAVYEVIDTERAPGDTGGFTGYGRDVGVLHLATQVANVNPVCIAGLDDIPVGTRFVTMGFGYRDNFGAYGVRRIGRQTLKARTGRTWEALFGSFEAFFEWYTGEPVPTDCDSPTPANPYLCNELGYLRYDYESLLLDPTGQIVAGGVEGDAQPCYGDSGSPLLKSDQHGKLVAYAVVNGGVSSDDLICDYGGVYTSFSPEVLTFLEHAKNYVDPCAGLSKTGICDGSVARRCTNRQEGGRRITEVDCAEVGLSCQVQADGTVGCGSSTGAVPTTPPMPLRASSESEPTTSDVILKPGDPLPAR